MSFISLTANGFTLNFPLSFFSSLFLYLGQNQRSNIWSRGFTIQRDDCEALCAHILGEIKGCGGYNEWSIRLISGWKRETKSYGGSVWLLSLLLLLVLPMIPDMKDAKSASIGRKC